ncbi:MAG TPA: hypothetical protein VFM60_08090, partial [Salinimicrobium sp.]|nr:hypothetical protein [Salinimicrobium sp.]
INYAGFYADCDHEVKPLTSGVRVCLVYNLIQQKAGKMMKPLSLQTNANKLAGLFTENNSLNLPYIILLGHQYTPANFSEQALKLNDRAKAEALLLAAKQAGYYAKFCLVTSYLTGSPEYNDHYDENDTEMGEVFEEDLYIEHWLDHKLPTFDYISFEENQLITSFRLNEEEPLIKESTGYMGNYGPDVMHWYHYGAMMIWSPEVNAQLLLAQNTATQLRWISYFNSVEKISDAEVMAIEDILINGFESRYRGGKKEDFNVVANWLINRNEKTFLINLNRERLQFFFVKIDTDSWIRLLQFMAVEHTKRLFEKIIEQVTLPVLEKLLEVLNAMTDKAELKPIAIEQTILLPDLFQSVHANTSREINATAISDLFQLTQIPTEKEWTNEIFETITEKPNWEYLHKVLVPQLMAATNPSGLTEKLLSFCHEYLQKRVNNKPQPPADWSRSLPETKNSKAQWQILKDFLESPSEIVFDFRRKQMERTDMEAAIRNVVIDLKTETIRKGSPHILRISKTQDAYNRLLKNWLTDVALLGRLK